MKVYNQRVKMKFCMYEIRGLTIFSAVIAHLKYEEFRTQGLKLAY